MKTKLILTLLYLCSLSLFAEVNFNNEMILWQLPEKKIIPSSLKPSTTVFDIKDVVIPNGYQAILMFDARILSSANGGWNPYLGITINNNIVGRLTKNHQSRLLCRNEVLKTTYAREKQLSMWNPRGKTIRLLNFFAPEKDKEFDQRITTL